MATIEVVRAPFTPGQVASLNAYQAAGQFHPYTCGGADCRGALIAAEGGWHCPACDHTQDWAHPAHADGSWRRHAGITAAAAS